MMRLSYRLLALLLGTAAVTGCSKSAVTDLSPSLDNPNTKAGLRSVDVASTTSAFSYTQYLNLPEPMLEVFARPYIYTSAGVGYRYPYALGRALVAGGHTIYSFSPAVSTAPYSPTNGTWNTVAGPNGGGALKLAMGTDYNYNSYFYALVAPANIINDPSTIWGFSGLGGWGNTGIAATDISVGSQASGIPILYYINKPKQRLGSFPVTNNTSIYWLNNSTPTLIASGTNAVSLAADGYGGLWYVDSAGQVYVNRNPRSGGAFVQVPGSGRRIASDGLTVALIGTNHLTNGYEVYSRDASAPTTQGFQLEPGEATAIGSNAIYDYFTVNDAGDVFLVTH